MPVSISPIHRHVQRGAQLADQLAILVVDRTPAVEVIVVFRDFEQPLARNVAPAQHVLEERNHFLMFFGSTERNHHQRVVHRHVFILATLFARDSYFV